MGFLQRVSIVSRRSIYFLRSISTFHYVEKRPLCRKTERVRMIVMTEVSRTLLTK